MKDKTIELFEKYVSKYDMENKNIKHKHYHTYRVLKEMEDLVKSIDLNEYDTELALIIAILHDIGRFKQLELTNSYNDSKLNHALFSVEVLNTYEGFLDIPIIKENKILIEKALYNHNRLFIEEDVNERELFFCKLIRDADKLDILYIISNGIIQEKAINEVISDEVFKAVENKKQVNRKDIVNNIDMVICDVSMVFDINFKHSIDKILMSDYIDKIIERLLLKNESEISKLIRIKIMTNEYLKQNS